MDTCIIIGNGKSLQSVPRSFLDAYPSFGTNAIFLRNDTNLAEFNPTYYVAVNLDLAPYAEQINELCCVKFIGSRFADKVIGSIPVRKNYTMQFFETPPDDFSLWEGYGVTYVCLQIAYWLGYQTALLVGVDHRYSNEDPKGNHFCDEYEELFPVIDHNMENLMPAYRLARDAYAAAGRRIINLTPDSALDIFPKGNINEWK